VGAGVTLGPPLWATGSWAVDAWADGTWATEITLPTDFGDLTTLFCGYLETLVNDDVSTLVMKAQPNVRNTANSKDDLNTSYAEFLS
jgi:hypothetical protein